MTTRFSVLLASCAVGLLAQTPPVSVLAVETNN